MKQREIYLEMHKLCPLQKGDKVKFYRGWDDGEFGHAGEIDGLTHRLFG